MWHLIMPHGIQHYRIEWHESIFQFHIGTQPKLKGWDRIVAAAATNEECYTLVEYIQKEFPKVRYELPLLIQQFWPLGEQLYSLKGVSIKNNKILIPKQLRA